MKLIKLTPTHYVVVDGSKEIEAGDIVAERLLNGTYSLLYIDTQNDIDKSSQLIVTHSTDSILLLQGFGIRELNLSEVKALIGEVDVEKKAEELTKHLTFPDERKEGIVIGYNQALEDNKEKKYTEEDLKKAIKLAQVVERDHEDSDSYLLYSEDEIIQSLQPKTEWEVEFVDGKLKLKCQI